MKKQKAGINLAFAVAAATVMLSTKMVYAAGQELAYVEEVLVTGIRGSLERALDIKKDSAGFVDAISAEDIGKLPDQNVAEALQRVTGVAIQRSRGEGDFISIRGLGPDFVRGSINGRSIVSATETFDGTIGGGKARSTGRATNFDVLPSEIVSTLAVVKSTSAKHVEGGIGGAVDIITARPLALGNKFAWAAEGTYRQFSEETDPKISGLASFVNDDSTLGVVTSLTYSERSIREDFSRGFGWFQCCDSADINNDGTGDGALYIPLSNNVESFVEDRETVTFASTVQWAPDEETEIVLDLLYSNRTLEHDEQQVILVTLPFAGDYIREGITVNPDGSAQVQGLLNGGTLSRIPFGIPPEIVADRQDNEDEVVSLGINFSKQIGDWKLRTDLSYSRAEGSLDFQRAVIVGDGGGVGTYAYNADIRSDGFNINDAGSTAGLSDPANYFIRNGTLRLGENEDEELAFRFDAEFNLEGSLISSIETGLRLRSREKQVTQKLFDNHFRTNPAGTDTLGFERVGGNSFVRGNGDFLDGDWGSLNFSDFIFPDIAATYGLINSQPVIYDSNGAVITATPAFDPLNSYEVEEDTFAAYVQFNLEGEVGNVPFAGDVGFRVVHTQQDVLGNARPFVVSGGTIVFTSPDVEALSFDDTYTNILPSLNLRFELQPELFLRLAASKSVTRPTFADLAPRLTINPSATIDLNNDGVAATASGGNPGLKPYESTNFDLGVEWYFAESSAVYAGIFYKELENYIASVTNLDVTLESVVFDTFSQPDNQGEAEIAGLELGYQHAFDNGMGYIANFTLTENEAEFEQSGGDIPFPGVSDASYNFTLYYDKGPWQARLSYSYRDDFLLEPSPSFGAPLFVNEYGQLDGSVSYAISDRLALYFNAVNIAAENAEIYSEVPTIGRQFYSDAHVGARYAIGIRGTF